MIRNKGCDANTMVNDVGLLVLAKPSATTPVTLAPSGAGLPLVKGQALTIVGWGGTQHSSFTWQLQYGTVPFMPTQQCSRAMDIPVPATSLCAGGWACGWA